MSPIGGALDTDAMARMHFHALDRAAQAQAIQRLAASGRGEHTIAHATGLSVEQIRRILRQLGLPCPLGRECQGNFLCAHAADCRQTERINVGADREADRG